MPVKGWRLRGELRGSHSALGAQADFLRFSGLASLVRPMGAKWRLSVRGELGTSAVDGLRNTTGSVGIWLFISSTCLA